MQAQQRSPTLFILTTAAILLALANNRVIRCRAAEEAERNLVDQSPINRLLVMTALSGAATSEKLVRLNRSAEAFGLDIEFVQAGTGQSKSTERLKFDKLREALERHRDTDDLVVLLLLDGPNSIINGDKVDILQRFQKLSRAAKGSRVVFSADAECRPNVTQSAADYAQMKAAAGGYECLNSRALIGYVSSVYEVFQTIAERLESKQTSELDFQAQSTRVYLNELERERLAVSLDHKWELLASLDARKPYAEDEIELDYSDEERIRVRSLAHDTRPLVIHAGGLGRVSRHISTFACFRSITLRKLTQIKRQKTTTALEVGQWERNCAQPLSSHSFARRPLPGATCRAASATTDRCRRRRQRGKTDLTLFYIAHNAT